MKGQIGKIFLFGIPVVLIIIIGVLLYIKSKPISTQITNPPVSTTSTENVNINSTPSSTPINTSGFPNIIFRSVEIPYGLSMQPAFNTNFFTGKISKATAVNDVLTVDVSDPTKKSFSEGTYSFHFPKFIGIAEMTDPNQAQMDLVSTSATDATQKLTPGKYVSIMFDNTTKFSSISDMTSNEAGIRKSIIIYSFIAN